MKLDSTTSIGPTTDEVLTSAAETAADDPLDTILRQIIGGFFVLTDGQGAVSKWCEPAELLFGRRRRGHARPVVLRDADRAPVPAAAESWRRFLEAGEAPTARRAQSTSPASSADGSDVPARGRLRPGQARRGLRLLALPRGPRLRAPDEPDAAAHAPAAPGRGARAAPGARAEPPALGGLAHRRHARRLPPARRRPRGSRTSWPAARPRAPRPTPRSRSASPTPTPASRATRSPTSTTPPPSSRACCRRWSASTSSSKIAAGLPASSRRPAARPRQPRAPRPPSARPRPSAPR